MLTGWEIAHTLSNSANAILFEAYSSTYNPACSGNVYVGLELRKDGTLLSQSSTPDSGTIQSYGNSYFSSQNYMNPIFLSFLTKPGDTSSHDYELYIYSNTGAQSSSNVSWSQTFMRITEIDGSICTLS